MLTVTLACVGHAKAGAHRELTSRYLERARLAGRSLGLAVELREFSESRARRPHDRKREEGEALRTAFEGVAEFLSFDATGASIDSESLAAILRRGLEEARPLVCFIGGPDGLDASIRERSAQVVAFGAMTWPHQLVRIMAAEQIYRAITILSGHPYHRA